MDKQEELKYTGMSMKLLGERGWADVFGKAIAANMQRALNSMNIPHRIEEVGPQVFRFTMI